MNRYALYRCIDDDGQLLYVGITIDSHRRITEHAKRKPWWSDVSNIIVESFPTRDAAIFMEREVIRREQPKHNIIHNRKKPTP